MHPIMDALSRTIARHKKNAKSEGIILRDLAAIMLLFLAATTLNEVVSALRLPTLFNLADDAAFLLALVFIWDLLRHAIDLGRKRRAIAQARCGRLTPFPS
jgi:hypothetical protein